MGLHQRSLGFRCVYLFSPKTSLYLHEKVQLAMQSLLLNKRAKILRPAHYLKLILVFIFYQQSQITAAYLLLLKRQQQNMPQVKAAV